MRCLTTSRGSIPLPAVIPVTTYGDAFPTDRLIRPYLPRVAPAVLVSYHYAQDLRRDRAQRPACPLIIDSGAFGLLAVPGARYEPDPGMGGARIHFPDGTVLDRSSVLVFQQDHADVGCTLDIPIPPGTPVAEAHERFEATLRNAAWALQNRQRRDMPLLASIQVWDAASAREAASRVAAMRGHDGGFAGIAIGGLVPRMRDRDYLAGVIGAVRGAWEGPIHIFGLGQPDLVRDLIAWGADSTDTSTYVRQAVDGRSVVAGVAPLTDGQRTPSAIMQLALRNYLAIADPQAARVPLSVAASWRAMPAA